MTNPKSDYNDNVRANLPDELSWSEDLGKYQSHTWKRFPQYPEGKRYADYLPKFQTNALKVFPHLDYCFQDTLGTTRANVGDPVALLLDRSEGAKHTEILGDNGEVAHSYFSGLGPELVPDPDFKGGIAGWLDSSTAPGYVEWGAANEAIALVHGGGSNHARTHISHTPETRNKWYALEIEGIAGNSNNLAVYYGGNQGLGNISSYSKVYFILPPTDDGALVSIRNFDPDTTALIGRVSIRELKGYHLYQDNDDQRPTLQQDPISGKYYLEFDGVDDFLKTGSWHFFAEFTSTISASVSDATTSFPHLLSVRGSTFNNPQDRHPLLFIFNTGGSAQGRLGFSHGTNNAFVSQEKQLDKGAFVAQTRLEGGQSRSLLNGKQETVLGQISEPSPIAEDPSETQPLALGDLNGTGGANINFYGLSMSPRALTDEEITKEYREHAIHAGLI